MQDSPPGLVPGGTLNASDARSATAIVVAGDEETRVLLRGLLRLHHFRVEGEAEGATHALELVRDRRPSLMVTDVTLAEGSATAAKRLSNATTRMERSMTILTEIARGERTFIVEVPPRRKR